MNWFNKILNFAYTLLIVFCLTRLAVLEPNQLAKILEIILAITAIVKAINFNNVDSTDTDDVDSTLEETDTSNN